MYRFRRYWLSLFLLSIMPAFAAAADKNTIEVRTIGFPPYGITTGNRLSGIYFDVANILLRESGYISHNRVSPYARIIKEMKSGDIDLTIMFRYPELEDYVDYVAPLPSLKTVVIGLKGTHFADLDSLSGKKIAYLRGAKFSDVIYPCYLKMLCQALARTPEQGAT